MSITPVLQCFILTTVFIATCGQNALAANEADVIVYGSAPGGFCAAIAAAREGAKVILLEPTDIACESIVSGQSCRNSAALVTSLRWWRY